MVLAYSCATDSGVAETVEEERLPQEEASVRTECWWWSWEEEVGNENVEDEKEWERRRVLRPLKRARFGGAGRALSRWLLVLL